MSLSEPQYLYGTHQLTFYNRETLIPYGKPIQVIGNIALNAEGETAQLQGGSFNGAWATARGRKDYNLTAALREFPQYLFDLAETAVTTSGSAEASGNVGTLTNKKGTSVMNATTGVASVAALAGSEANLKPGRYVVEAASATTVNIYALDSNGFLIGADGEYADDTGKITATAETITASTDSDITAFGFKLTGGSGTIGMTTGDTAYFDVRAINEGYEITTVGDAATCATEFGLRIDSELMPSGDSVQWDCFKCLLNGLPQNMNEKEFSEAELTIQLAYDADNNGVYSMVRTKGTAGC